MLSEGWVPQCPRLGAQARCWGAHPLSQSSLKFEGLSDRCQILGSSHQQLYRGVHKGAGTCQAVDGRSSRLSWPGPVPILGRLVGASQNMVPASRWARWVPRRPSTALRVRLSPHGVTDPRSPRAVPVLSPAWWCWLGVGIRVAMPVPLPGGCRHPPSRAAPHRAGYPHAPPRAWEAAAVPLSPRCWGPRDPSTPPRVCPPRHANSKGGVPAATSAGLTGTMTRCWERKRGRGGGGGVLAKGEEAPALWQELPK